MALPTLLSLYVALRQAVFEHPEDMAGSSPAVLGVMFCPLPFAEDDIENATLEAQAQLRRQVLSKKDKTTPVAKGRDAAQLRLQQQEHGWLARAAKTQGLLLRQG